MARLTSVGAAVTLAMAAHVSASRAQEASGPDDPSPSTLTKAAQVNSAVSAPGAQLTASKGSASISLKLSAKPRTSVPEGKGAIGTATWSRWSLVAEAPIKKGEDRYDLLSHDGWGDATSIGLNYTSFHTGWTPQNKEAWRASCATMRENMYKAKLPENASQAKREATQIAVDKEGCVPENFQVYAPELEQTARRAKGGPDPGGVLWGFQARTGFQRSTFHDPASLQKSRERYHPWSAGVHAGWNPAAMSNLLLLAKADREHVYREGDDEIRCPVSAPGLVATCVEGAFAPPASSKQTILSLEARYLYKQLAIGAIAERNVTKDTTSVEIPIYFIGDGKGVLNGGVRVTWSSQDNWGAGVFIGVPIQLFD